MPVPFNAGEYRTGGLPMPHPFLSTLGDRLAAGRVSRREFLRTATLLGMSASVAYGTIGLADTATAQDGTPVPGGTLRLETTIYDLTTPPTTSTTADPNIFGQVVEHLTRTGADNVTRPHLLESWEPSEDLRSWTLKVRPGVTWHSGRPFLADDVIWNLTRLVSDEVGSSFLGLMEPFLLETYEDGTDEEGNPITRHRLWREDAIERVDDMTVRINLREPQLAIPEHLAHYPAAMLSPEDGGVFGPEADGTGPYRLEAVETGRRAVLVAVPGYWGGGPWIERVEFVDLGGNAQTIASALASGQVDGAFAVQPEFAPLLDARETLRAYQVTTADTAVTRMHCTTPPFDDPRVRRAMRLAIDPVAAAGATFGPYATPAEHHHVAPVHPEYAPLPPWTRDVEGARALLAEAGHPDGITVELTIQAEPPHHLRSASIMQEMWREAGINVEINVVPNPQYWDVWTTVPLGTTVWAHRPLGIMNLALAYRTGASWNESSYSNPELDRLLTEAEGLADPEARRGPMAAIEAIMQEDGPIVQTYWRDLLTYMDARVRGFAMHPTSQIYLGDLWIEES